MFILRWDPEEKKSEVRAYYYKWLESVASLVIFLILVFTHVTVVTLSIAFVIGWIGTFIEFFIGYCDLEKEIVEEREKEAEERERHEQEAEERERLEQESEEPERHEQEDRTPSSSHVNGVNGFVDEDSKEQGVELEPVAFVPVLERDPQELEENPPARG
jgi:hypothetical protein